VQDDLDTYLRLELPLHRESLSRVQALTTEVLGVFDRFFLDGNTWPYELVSGQAAIESKRYSFSTAAMITFALKLALGDIRQSVLVPEVDQLQPSLDGSNALRTKVARALTNLATKAVLKGRPKRLLTSETFGPDDPFTLTWLLETLRDETDATLASLRDLAITRADITASRVLSRKVAVKAGRPRDPLRDALDVDSKARVEHAFPLLRALQLAEAVSRFSSTTLSRSRDVSWLRDLLLRRIYYYLSQGDVASSEFDAADLIFSLEAWLLCTPVEPTTSVIDRVFELLAQTPSTGRSWRPIRPIKVTSQGFVLPPQSIEVANSLLRICSAPHLRQRDYFGRYRGLFASYLDWLLGRVFRSYTSEAPEDIWQFSGWESEHTYAGDRIHLWQTSQALIFLQTYSATLRSDIARTSLRLAGMYPVVIKPPPEPAGKVGSKVELGHEAPKPENWKDWEPMTADPSGTYQVYNAIQREVVQGNRGLASILLYGPPGTGKSTVAEYLALETGFPMITITPGDFITSGSEAVEGRAKALFDVLSQQSRIVILFDEIDNLLLDRDSRLYQNQSDVFQLLGPGMLTKLGRLTASHRVLLIIATNYYERIDRAIKRPGRIDFRYLVMPPDSAQRRRRLEKDVDNWDGLAEQRRAQIIRQTVRFTYKELTSLAAAVNSAGLSGSLLSDALLANIRAQPAVCNLSSYGVRLGWSDNTNGRVALMTVERPLEEVALIARLELEANKDLPDKPWWLSRTITEALNANLVRDPAVAAQLKAAVQRQAKGRIKGR
jgi:hypothetical protein